MASAEPPAVPDLTLIEADIRGVATLVELVEELRRINAKLDRVSAMEKMMRDICLGLGVPVQ